VLLPFLATCGPVEGKNAGIGRLPGFSGDRAGV
jgi:hypothetical protein